MKIHFEDEYDDILYTAEFHSAPSIGTDVSFDNEDYRVKKVTWVLERSVVLVSPTQTMSKTESTNDSSDRLSEMKGAILAVTQRQDKLERKGRLLREQLVSVRSYLKTQNRKPTQ